MDLRRLKRSIETMPRPAYIFLKYLLRAAAAMLCASLALFLTAGRDPARLHLAVTLLENPAGVLLVGAFGLAFLLDRCG
jgi:hypothetical protein